MAKLFIDSTYDITIGLINDEYEWIDRLSLSGKKASAILQPAIFNLCSKNKIKFSELSGIITVAGPGFYTGLRLSEGFADTLKFFSLPHFSFYSHDVAHWCGFKVGIWITKAYRGEFFVYRWSDTETKIELIQTKDIKEIVKESDSVFIHSKAALDEVSLSDLKSFQSTHDLLMNNSSKIFGKVCSEKMFKDSYYFRAPEDEFRMNP